MNQNFYKLLIDFKSIPKLKSDRTFMEISGYPHYENVCSNILVFFLNPDNEHGLKDLMLKSLMLSFREEYDFDFQYDQAEIARELTTNAGKRLDILIKTNNYVIGIENKIFHYLHNDLDDYAQTIAASSSNNQEIIKIILSLNELTATDDKAKIEKSGFINLTYQELFLNIKRYIGDYMTSSTLSYSNYLMDFTRTIENLIQRKMENKELDKFFKDNFDTITELTNKFNEYKNSLYNQIYQLQAAIPQDKFAPNVDKQWIYKNYCLVHDYTIDENFKISVDVHSDTSGWDIQLFARDQKSADFLFNKMCQDSDFLPHPFEEYERNSRLIYAKFEVNTDVSIIAKSLIELLDRIEKYKLKTANTQ